MSLKFHRPLLGIGRIRDEHHPCHPHHHKRHDKYEKAPAKAGAFLWQGHKDLNPEPTVLETAALPIELYPYMVGLRGLEPGTGRL